MTTIIAFSHTCSAIKSQTIGTRIVYLYAFHQAIKTVLATYDTSQDRVAGQHFVQLPASSYGTVSAGVGRWSDNPDDYVVREHRGQVNLYLKREKAAAVEGLHVVVYTKEAYMNDPDVQKEGNLFEWANNTRMSHVVVAVLASAGPRSPLTPDRFVKNLAGGNNEALTWNADEIRAKAKEIADYYSEWCVVAD